MPSIDERPRMALTSPYRSGRACRAQRVTYAVNLAFRTNDLMFPDPPACYHSCADLKTHGF